MVYVELRPSPQFLCKYTREQSKRVKPTEAKPSLDISSHGAPVASEAVALQCRGVFANIELDSRLKAHIRGALRVWVRGEECSLYSTSTTGKGKV